MKNLKEKVEYILDKFEYSRNDDDYLIIKLYKEWFDFDKNFPIESIEIFYNLFKKLPKSTDVVRWRQKLQSEGKYLPTDLEIMEKRRSLEKKYRNALNYSVNSWNQE